jgi:hypothetical protein
VKYDDDSSNKIVIASDGSATVTNDDEPGAQISGRLEPQIGSNASAWQFNIVDQQVKTNIAGFVAAGATRIQVSSAVGFEVGSEVVIDAGTLFEESNIIKGFGSILLETPTKFDHEVGATVSASSNGEQYRLKIQDGVLVVGRFADSTWVAGSGTLEVPEAESSNEVSIGLIMIVVGGLGLLSIVIAIALLCMHRRRRAGSNMAPTVPVHMNDQVSTRVAEPPNLLGTLQGSSLTNSKRSRDALEACNHGVEISDVENALDTEHKQSRGEHGCTHDVSLDITNDREDEEIPERLSRRDIEAANEDSSMPNNRRVIKI